MNEPKRKAFRVTRLKVSDLHKEAQEQLENLFMGLEAARQDMVQAQRKASIKTLKAQGDQLEFLEVAASYFNEVATEPIWFVYRKGKEIILESPFTEKDQRNVIRAQRELLARQVGDGETTDSELYESGEEEDEENGQAAS